MAPSYDPHPFSLLVPGTPRLRSYAEEFSARDYLLATKLVKYALKVLPNHAAKNDRAVLDSILTLLKSGNSAAVIEILRLPMKELEYVPNHRKDSTYKVTGITAEYLDRYIHAMDNSGPTSGFKQWAKRVRGKINIWNTVTFPAELEAEVSLHLVTHLLLPCMEAANNALAGRRERTDDMPFLRLYAQDRLEIKEDPDDRSKAEELSSDDPKIPGFAKGKKVTISDHVIKLHRGEEDKEGETLVFIEVKRPTSVNLNSLKVLKSRPGRQIRHVDDVNMRNHLAQVIRYHERYDCSYAMLSDGLTTIPMIWEEPAKNAEPIRATKLHYWNSNSADTSEGMSLLFLIYRALREKKVIIPDDDDEEVVIDDADWESAEDDTAYESYDTEEDDTAYETSSQATDESDDSFADKRVKHETWSESSFNSGNTPSSVSDMEIDSHISSNGGTSVTSSSASGTWSDMDM